MRRFSHHRPFGENDRFGYKPVDEHMENMFSHLVHGCGLNSTTLAEDLRIQGIHYDDSTCRRWIRGELHVPKPVFNRVTDIAEYVFDPNPNDNDSSCFPPAATRMRAYRLAVELAYDCKRYDKADSHEAKMAIAARMQSNSELIPTTTRYLPSSRSVTASSR